MIPYSDNPQRGAPLPPPAAGALDAPLRALCVNDEWLSYLIGALESLADVRAWDAADDAAALLLVDQVNLLIAEFSNSGTC